MKGGGRRRSHASRAARVESGRRWLARRCSGASASGRIGAAAHHFQLTISATAQMVGGLRVTRTCRYQALSSPLLFAIATTRSAAIAIAFATH